MSIDIAIATAERLVHLQFEAAKATKEADKDAWKVIDVFLVGGFEYVLLSSRSLGKMIQFEQVFKWVETTNWLFFSQLCLYKVFGELMDIFPI